MIVLVARDGVLLRKLPGADEYANWAELGFEIPEPVPPCPPAVVDEIWGESPSGL